MNGYYEDLVARLRNDPMSITLMHEAASALEEKIQTEKELRAALEDLSGKPFATVTVRADIDNFKALITEIGKLQKYKLFQDDDMVLISIDKVLELLQAHLTTKAV